MKSASLTLLRRPAPEPYFHTFFNFSEPPNPPPPLGEVIKIYSPRPSKKGGPNYESPGGN